MYSGYYNLNNITYYNLICLNVSTGKVHSYSQATDVLKKKIKWQKIQDDENKNCMSK